MISQSRGVVIVGAGPAGMALGYLLARRGIAVTVLEMHRDFARSFRGEGMQKSGIDAIRQMGLGEQFDRIPFAMPDMLEIYQGGKRRARVPTAGVGRPDVRMVSQPVLLGMLAEEAGKFPGFALKMGLTVRELLRENGRVVGVRASEGSEQHEFRAALVIGTDGRHAATRKQSGLPEINAPQSYDILWFKIPMPERYPDRKTVQTEMAPDRVALAFPSADGQLQMGFIIPKGDFAKRRALGPEAWTESLIGRLPNYLAEQLRAHRDTVANATLLNVVCGRLAEWSIPGLLMLGDAAHPMSPVGGQGVNLALRDALVAANHLCPLLTSGANAEALDAAAKQVQAEREPEIIAAQKMQTHQAGDFFAVSPWKIRVMTWVLPILFRTGVLQWSRRNEYRIMSEGSVPVKLVV
jgi:2-polyprenyl-6-methoxyphenol hydroxylase-like FAD-dependent oxidoreductase